MKREKRLLINFDEINSRLPFELRWENLTLANDFMFGKVMHDEELCTEMMRRILPEMEIGRIEFVQPQKSSKHTFDTRGVRFDIFAKSDNRKIFDCKVQTTDKKDLPKRTRAYHITIGLEALHTKFLRKSGSYNDLTDVFVIFICTFDPFGQGRHIYSFRNVCSEDNNLQLNDGAYTVFLNTKGTKNDVNPELKAFLDFINGKSSSDPFVKKLEERLLYAKQNVVWRENYMFEFLRDEEKIGEGIAIGEERGIAVGEKRGIALGEKRGIAIGEARGIAVGEARTKDSIMQRLISRGMSSSEAAEIVNLPFENN